MGLTMMFLFVTGMLLDRDRGTMSVYKNDVLLGVMQGEGLTGEYRWAVAVSPALPLL